MKPKEIIVRHIEEKAQQFQDSISLGTEAKGGNVKVYCDFSRPEEAKAKIDEALKLREYAKAKLEAG